MITFLFGGMAHAQFNGTISGTVVDANQQPIPGVAVFYYGKSTQLGGVANLSINPNDFIWLDYTDANGNYTLNYSGAHADTLVVGALDCQKALVTGVDEVFTSAPNASINLQIACAPLQCDVVFQVYSSNWGPGVGMVHEIYAHSLLDSSYAPNLPAINHSWTYNGVTRTSNYFQGTNRDSIWILSPTLPNVCYSRSSVCSPQCVGGTTPPRLNCSANFYVDTVNSINFQGQVVIWENSSLDTSASIIGYRWDFGDGNYSTQQYPTHTYNDTGVYEVCLTIYSHRGADTCVSTFCDSIGFDANGNLVYKTAQQGFTINVIDPATIGQNEIDFSSHFDLFPNPSDDKATLSWDESLGVTQIDVITMDGQVVKSINPEGGSVSLNSLNTGLYIVRVNSEQGATTLKMMVK